MATATEAVRRSTYWPEWLAFLAQCFIAISVEVGDDLGRGLFSQHGTLQGINNARDIVAFEAAHGLWVEPGWQMFFEKSYHVFALTITWADTSRLFNAVYVLGHIFVTLGVAAWVYFFRRRFFALFRNMMIVTNILALILYENFPVAPPRMMPPLAFNGHWFSFEDTMYGVLSASGHYAGSSSSLAYNEFSAMPSVHMAWALIIGTAIICLARPLPAKLLGLLYPALMLMSIVVTGNHFLMDAVGAALVVALAAGIAIGLDWARRILPWQLPAAIT